MPKRTLDELWEGDEHAYTQDARAFSTDTADPTVMGKRALDERSAGGKRMRAQDAQMLPTMSTAAAPTPTLSITAWNVASLSPKDKKSDSHNKNKLVEAGILHLRLGCEACRQQRQGSKRRLLDD